MFKVGDKVRFVTTEPEYDALYFDGEMIVFDVCSNGDYEIEYPAHEGWPNGLSQTVSPDDIEIAS